jgi:trehalose 6-phosphate phosphatase
MSCESEGEKPLIINIPDFWDRLRGAQKRLLALDYDGTLAPFHIERMEAEPLVGIPELLKQIQDRDDTTLAIISGRPVFELVSLVGNIGVTMVGSHGFELRGPDGAILIKKITPEQEEGLMEARAIGIEAGLEERLETKTASIALHTRGLSPDEASLMEDEMHETWGNFAARHHLEVKRFNGGVELRATGWNKGDALESLLLDLKEETLCVYIGDDETDEDAFERIQPYGFGIRVGDPSQPSKAHGFLPDTDCVKRFLQAWKDMACVQL